MPMALVPFSSRSAADNTNELEAIVIQSGVDKRANGAALLAQINRSQGAANIRDYGAKLDGKITTGSMSSGNATLSNAPSGTFTSTAVDAGKLVYVAGAGAAGAPLLTTIATVTNSTTAVLSASAGTSVTNAVLVFGTDDRTAWMNAINHLIYVGGTGGIVLAPPGISVIGDTILAGYGEVVPHCGLTIQGAGIGVTTIFARFHDRPALSFQGLLVGAARGFSIRGLNQEYVKNNYLGTLIVNATIDDTVASNWLNPTLTADSINAPYVGIAVDPVAGTMPTTHYPTVNYDTSVYPSPTQYNKYTSAYVLVEDVEVSGFCAGAIFSPADVITLGQHVDFSRVAFGYSKWGLSVSSSGDCTADNLSFTQVFSCIANEQHGRATGTVIGALTNWRAVDCNQVFQFGDSAQPVEFCGLYGKVQRIGSVGTASNPAITSVVSDFVLDFNLASSAVRGTPPSVLSNTQPFVFRNGTMNFASVVGLGSSVSFENVAMNPSTGRGNAFERFAHNALCGGMMTWLADSALSTRGERRLKWKGYNLDTAAALVYDINRESGFMAYTSRPFCIPLYVDQAGNSAGNRNSVYPTVPPILVSLAKSALTAKSLTNRTLVFTVNQTTAQQFYFGPQPGDVLVDDQTNSTFFVRSVTGSTGAYVVMAELQHNYRTADEGRSYTNPVAISLTTGNFLVVNARVYTTTFALFGTITSGSANITAAGKSDGVNTFMTTDLVNGDYVLMDTALDNWLAVATTGILSAVANGSFTVGANAQYTQTKKRLPFFIRPGPANNIATLTLSAPWTVTTGVHNQPFSSYVGISGGIPTYNTPLVASGALPSGISLSISGGKLIASGTLGSGTGTYNGTVTVKDSQAAPATSNALAFSFIIS